MSAFSPLRTLLNRYRRGVTLTSLLLVSSLMILFSGTPGIAKPQEIGLTVFSFFQGMVSNTALMVGQSAASMGDYLDLKKKYEEVKENYQHLEGSERIIVGLKDQVKRLEEQLQFHQALEFPNIPVQVIAKDPSKVYASFIIDKGYLDGIRKNMPVVATQDGNTGLVGKILDVGLSSSIVQPILDANLFVSARFQNSRYEGIVTGKGNNEESLNMLYVKKTAKDEIKISDLVVTAGLDSLYPQGILLGRVKAIGLKEYETSLQLELEPVLSFSRLEYLSVIRKEQ